MRGLLAALHAMDVPYTVMYVLVHLVRLPALRALPTHRVSVRVMPALANMMVTVLRLHYQLGPLTLRTLPRGPVRRFLVPARFADMVTLTYLALPALRARPHVHRALVVALKPALLALVMVTQCAMTTLRALPTIHWTMVVRLVAAILTKMVE